MSYKTVVARPWSIIPDKLETLSQSTALEPTFLDVSHASREQAWEGLIEFAEKYDLTVIVRHSEVANKYQHMFGYSKIIGQDHVDLETQTNYVIGLDVNVSDLYFDFMAEHVVTGIVEHESYNEFSEVSDHREKE